MEVALEAAAALVADSIVLILHLQTKSRNLITQLLRFTLLRHHLSPKNKEKKAFSKILFELFQKAYLVSNKNRFSGDNQLKRFRKEDEPVAGDLTDLEVEQY